MRRYLTGILLVAWMAVIFLFSAQPAVDSAEVSQTVGYYIVSWHNRVFRQGKTEGELRRRAEELQFFIRKGAHMSEYAVLGVLALAHMLAWRLAKKKAFPAAWALAAAYAVTDEIHQLFVPGRAGMAVDVCIDAMGALAGLAAACAAMRIAGMVSRRMRERGAGPERGKEEGTG